MLSFRNNMQIKRMQVNRVCLAFYRRFPNAYAVVDAENTEEYRNGTIFYLQFLSPRCFIIIKIYISSASIIVSFLSTLIYCKMSQVNITSWLFFISN